MLYRPAENWRDLDKTIIVCVLLSVCAGLLAIYSAATPDEASELLKNNFTKQIIWFLFGILIASAAVVIPAKFLSISAYWIYGLSLVLLVLVLLVGGGKGVHRWFAIGSFHFQPSELAKIATVLALARYATGESRDLRRFKDILVAFLMVIIPAVLILKQPDLGTAAVLLGIVLPMLFWAGLSPFIVFLFTSPLLTIVASFNFYTFLAAMILIVGVLFLTKRRLPVLIAVFIFNISIGALTPNLWNRLHDYQKTRILTFVGLEEDPRGTGYQVAQSQVAIGSGGFWGKGWARGTQTKLRFLPEQHTDFIFSVIGEEFGFLGVALMLLTFYILLWRSLQIAIEVKNRFMTVVVIGCISVLAVHVIVNTGMTVGIMPVTGIPLPFLSYGGSALTTNMILVALVLNAGAHRFQY